MTKFPLRPLLAALPLALPMLAQAADADASMWSFSGFGTLSAVHSDESRADFLGSVFQPNGAGRTHATSLTPDSKLGLQLNAKFSPELSGVVQLVSQHQYNNSFTPQIEWANLKYEFSPALRVRAGRIAMPSFLVSETRFVGFANPWIRPPQEVYGVGSITSNDGVDASYVSHFGNAVNTVQGYLGSSKAKLPTGDVTAKASWGLNNSLELGSTTLRAGFTSMKLDMTLPSVQPLLSGLTGFGAAASAIPLPSAVAAGAQANALASAYSLQGVKLKTFSLGASHDVGQWFVMGEYTRFTGGSFFSTSNSAYATAGYRMGKWTPFFTLASIKTDVKNESGISTAGLPAALAAGAAGLNGGLNSTKAGFGSSQNSISVGLRWDFMKNVAAKVQYDRINIGANSKGRLGNASPAFVNGGKVNLLAVSVDYLF